MTEQITEANFCAQLQLEVPGTSPVVAEHLSDNSGELLLHLLCSDLLRFAVTTFQRKDIDRLERLLNFVDRALRNGDEGVSNAVSVSFVEHYGFGEGESEEMLTYWPEGLRVEFGEQRTANP